MKKSIIIFSGFNPRAVIAFLRTLEANNVDYGIIAKSEDDDIFLTEYSYKVMAVRSVTQLEMNDLKLAINKLQKQLQADEYIIAPSTEALNRFLLDNLAAFEELGCRVPLVDKALYEKVSDKHAFGELCKDNGISIPVERGSVESLAPPFVAKPKTYFAANGQIHTPVLVLDQEDRDRFLADYTKEDFYFQEYIEGQSLYLLYYFYKNGAFEKFSQKNLLQQPGGKSIVGAVSTNFHLSSESELYEDMFKSVSFRGLVMVEVKHANNKHYMIEANPRFWGPSQLFVDAGVNLFEAFLADYGLLPKKPLVDEGKKVRYFWRGGINYVDNEPQLAFHDYDKFSLEREFEDWLNADVYNRNDTKNLYEAEVRRIQ